MEKNYCRRNTQLRDLTFIIGGGGGGFEMKKKKANFFRRPPTFEAEVFIDPPQQVKKDQFP